MVSQFTVKVVVPEGVRKPMGIMVGNTIRLKYNNVLFNT
jgi:hypothetical protein